MSTLLQSCEVINVRAVEVILAINNPLDCGHDDDNGKGHDAIVHAGSSDWNGRGENEEYGSDNDIGYAELFFS